MFPRQPGETTGILSTWIFPSLNSQWYVPIPRNSRSSISLTICIYRFLFLVIPFGNEYEQALPRNVRKRNDKFDGNVLKRGNVPLGKAGDRKAEGPGPSPWIIAFLMVLVVGSALVGVLNLFVKAPPVIP